MEFRQENNQLINMKNMGFSITWSLINTGINLEEKYGIHLLCEDVLEFLKHIIAKTNNYQDDIIQIICYEDNVTYVKNKVEQLSGAEPNHFELNIRKWRALSLKELLDNCDTFSSVALYDFWLIFDNVDPQPTFYPHNSVSFLSQSLDDLVTANKRWLQYEIKSIISLDESYNMLRL